MKIKILLGFATLFFPLFGMAESQFTLPWSIEDQEANTVSTDNAVSTHASARISYSRSGRKNIYFKLAYYDLFNDRASDRDYCDPVGFRDRGIIFINGQAIKATLWCEKYVDASNHYLEATAQTDQGLSYIVNQLSRATESIELKIDGKTINISAEGFTAAWGKTTDKAL